MGDDDDGDAGEYGKQDVGDDDDGEENVGDDEDGAENVGGIVPAHSNNVKSHHVRQKQTLRHQMRYHSDVTGGSRCEQCRTTGEYDAMGSDSDSSVFVCLRCLLIALSVCLIVSCVIFLSR